MRLIRSENSVLSMFRVRPCSRMERLLASTFAASSPAGRILALPRLRLTIRGNDLHVNVAENLLNAADCIRPFIKDGPIVYCV